MPNITCTKCGKPKQPTKQYWYIQNCKPKQPCRECAKEYGRSHEAKKRPKKPLAPRPCGFCMQMFTPISQFANRRAHCYKPECVERAHRMYDAHRVVNAQRWREAQKKHRLKICPLCKRRRMPPEYHFSCKVCRLQAGRIEGDYIYHEAMSYEREEA